METIKHANEKKTPKILVIDHITLHRKGLIKLLKTYFPKIGFDEAENGLCALNLLKSETYDYVFLEIDLPVINGVELIRILRRTNTKVKVVVIAAPKNKSYMYDFIDLSISGFMLKSYHEDKLQNALKIIFEGGRYFPEELNVIVSNQTDRPSNAQKVAHMAGELSPKEIKIVLLICEQLTSGEISARLGISKTTVDTHRKRIFKKLNISNSVGLVLFAYRSGILSI